MHTIEEIVHQVSLCFWHFQVVLKGIYFFSLGLFPRSNPKNICTVNSAITDSLINTSNREQLAKFCVLSKKCRLITRYVDCTGIVTFQNCLFGGSKGVKNGPNMNACSIYWTINGDRTKYFKEKTNGFTNKIKNYLLSRCFCWWHGSLCIRGDKEAINRILKCNFVHELLSLKWR